jgi:hypothetical protein
MRPDNRNRGCRVLLFFQWMRLARSSSDALAFRGNLSQPRTSWEVPSFSGEFRLLWAAVRPSIPDQRAQCLLTPRRNETSVL